MMLSPSLVGPSRTLTALSAAAHKYPLVMMSPSASPKTKSGAAMATAMALHFFGYEFARGSNLALFTSTGLGFGDRSGSHYPFAMTFVSPVSMALLLAYGRMLDAKGPRRALRNTTLFCIGMLTLSGMAVTALQRNEAWAGIKLLSLTVSQLVVWASFVFQNSYAHLLYAQQWSFLGSIFTPAEAGRYYSYIAGLSSITSALGGVGVSKIVDRVGLAGLSVVAAVSLACTLLLADWAYSLSEKHGFDPSMELQRLSKQKKPKKQAEVGEEVPKQQSSNTGNSLWRQIRDSISLFRREPTLGALFVEALSFQCLSTILNTCLATRLRDAVPNDARRAAWTGNFYACVNTLSTMFQFLLLPFLNQRTEPRTLWRAMPALPLLCGVAQFLPASIFPSAVNSSSSALYLIAISFLGAKTMDYSLRGVLAEMAYLPLSFEARFKGKEIIAVFANRFGKSGMAFLLSFLHFAGGGGAGLSGLTLLFTSGWLASALTIANIIPDKAEASRLVAERNKNIGDGERKKD